VIRYDYYRDGTIALEAFKAGQYDVRQENSSKNWATGTTSPALRAGLIKKEQIPNNGRAACKGSATICAGRCFRIRGCVKPSPTRSISNGRTRICSMTPTLAPAAISNKFGIGGNSVPQGEELKILEEFRGQIPEQVFTDRIRPTKI